MKIGIITYHNAMNYGAVLQAYALQEWLKKNGCSVEILDYNNQMVALSYRQFRFKCIPKKNPFKTIIFLVIGLFRLLKFKRVKSIVKSMLVLSNQIKCINDVNLENYDVIIVGSDQLWNTKISGGYDLMYWGDFKRFFDGKVITYAISMNSKNLSSDDEFIIQNRLKNFDAISVREKSLKNKLEEIDNRLNISTCIDPTLLLDTRQWVENINVSIIPKEKYICIYAILERKNLVPIAIKFAKKHNLKYVIINPLATSVPFSRNYQPDNPLDFISLISHAEYVFTSSFHGLAFSVVFEREVYVYGEPEKNERMKDLLDSLNIGNRFFTKYEDIPKDKINYEITKQRLNFLRKQSQEYLYSCLTK